LFLSGAGLLAQQPSLSPHDRDLVLTMLRRARADVERYYYDPSFHGVDLKAQLALSERRLKSATSLADAFAHRFRLPVPVRRLAYGLCPADRRAHGRLRLADGDDRRFAP